MMEFEKHEELKNHIQRMALTGDVGGILAWSNFIDSLNGALLANSAGSCAVPEGYVLVPNKPTKAMFTAAGSINIRYGSDGMDIPYFTRLSGKEAQDIWSAMLSAIPSNSEGEKS